MLKGTDIRKWRDIGLLDKCVRIACFAGAACFAFGWLIEYWLTAAVLRQPDHATDIYRNAWPFKGRIGFLTDGQMAWSHCGHMFLYGWGLAFVAGCYIIRSEQREQRARGNALLEDRHLKTTE